MIGWDIRDVKSRARMLRLGCTGIASSDIKKMLQNPVSATELPQAER